MAEEAGLNNTFSNLVPNQTPSGWLNIKVARVQNYLGLFTEPISVPIIAGASLKIVQYESYHP